MSYSHHVFISACGTAGDVFPLAGIAVELKKRNIHVTLQASDYFKDIIEAHSIDFVSLGSADEYIAMHADPRMWDPDFSMEIVAADHVKGSSNPAFDYVLQQHINRQKTLVITNAVPSGARMAATLFSFPQALLIMPPCVVQSRTSLAAPHCWKIPTWLPVRLCIAYIQIINYFSVKYGWKPNQASKVFSLYYKIGIFNYIDPIKLNFPEVDLAIGLFPEWFAMRPRDWPKKLHLVGFPLFDAVNQSTREVVDAFIEQKGSPILFTTGTGVHDASNIFREGRRICEMLHTPGIFVGGRVGKELLEGSPLCLYVDYVDFEYTLPKCKTIIHHGGVGTLAQAIKAGIPQLIRPIKIDQPDNAWRIKRLGLGDFVLPKDFTAENVIPVLSALLLKAPYNKTLKMYSDELKKSNAVEKACDLIEQHLKKLESGAVVHELPQSFSNKLFNYIGFKRTPCLPFIKQQAPGGDGLACVAMLLSYHGKSWGMDELIKLFPGFSHSINLRAIIEILSLQALGARPLKCSVEDLHNIKLPAILFWEKKHFVVLQKVRNNSFTVLDPTLKRMTLNRHKFEQLFTEIVLEVAPASCNSISGTTM